MFVTTVSESQPCTRGYAEFGLGSGGAGFVAANDRLPWRVARGGISGNDMALRGEWMCRDDWGLGVSARSWALLGGGSFMVVSGKGWGSLSIMCEA
jgi:hypothetical protein